MQSELDVIRFEKELTGPTGERLGVLLGLLRDEIDYLYHSYSKLMIYCCPAVTISPCRSTGFPEEFAAGPLAACNVTPWLYRRRRKLGRSA
jgi:hypothetical protein